MACDTSSYEHFLTGITEGHHTDIQQKCTKSGDGHRWVSVQWAEIRFAAHNVSSQLRQCQRLVCGDWVWCIQDVDMKTTSYFYFRIILRHNSGYEIFIWWSCDEGTGMVTSLCSTKWPRNDSFIYFIPMNCSVTSASFARVCQTYNFFDVIWKARQQYRIAEGYSNTLRNQIAQVRHEAWSAIRHDQFFIFIYFITLRFATALSFDAVCSNAANYHRHCWYINYWIVAMPVRSQPPKWIPSWPLCW